MMPRGSGGSLKIVPFELQTGRTKLNESRLRVVNVPPRGIENKGFGPGFPRMRTLTQGGRDIHSILFGSGAPMGEQN
jgi:hypothetical protein